MLWTFTVSISSAIFGGAIGAGAILLVYAGERRGRQRHAFNASIADLMREMSSHATTLREMAKKSPKREGIDVDHSKIVTALAVAQLVANADEFAVLQRLAAPIEFAALGADTYWSEASSFESWASELMLWRRGIVTSDKIKQDLLAAEVDFLKVMGVSGPMIERVKESGR